MAMNVRGQVNVAIAWYGLPFYGAKVIAEAQAYYPGARFTIIASHVGVPYEGIDRMLNVGIHWIDASKTINWSELHEPVPDFLILTSWCHVAYMSLAREAKRGNSTCIVSMVDNFFHNTPKQWLGAIYFRIKLRRLFNQMFVPGKRGTEFMKFLGMPESRITTGLYTADPAIFFPPADGSPRKDVVFVGQLIERKGMEAIVHVLQSTEGRKYKEAMRIIGHGPLAQKLKDLDMPVEAFKQPGDLRSVYQLASALLLPSKMDHWGVVAHEAALCGCVILATQQCGCVDDLVEHGVNGYVMESSSASEILKALTWHDSLSSDQLKIARCISIEKAAQFSPHKWAEKLGEIYPPLKLCR
jgi:glycosyltransferase involved in cell wall biosynthesis